MRFPVYLVAAGLDYWGLESCLDSRQEAASRSAGGGTDSQLVAFRATPNERVDVLTPAQQSGRMGNTYNFTFALPSGSIDHRRTGEQVAREAARRMQLAQGAV